MIRLSLSVTALFSLTVIASPATAQSVAQATVAEGTIVVAANRLDAKQVGLTRVAIAQHARAHETVPATTAATQAQSQSGRGRTLMIVGGAAFLAGLIIGDDAGNAIAIGGALVGIYGLYLWAQTQ